ncbi:MAG: signal transduction histidine kinase [Rhodothermales bacterium]
MRLRSQLLLLIGASVLVPLAILLALVREEMSVRLTEEYRERVTALIDSAEDRLEVEQADLLRGVGQLEGELAADPRLLEWLGGDSSWTAVLPSIGDLAADRSGVDWFVLADGDGQEFLGSGIGAGAAEGLPWQGRSLLPASLGSGDSVDRPIILASSLVALQATLLGDTPVRLLAGRRLDDAFWSGLTAHPAMATGLVVDGRLLAGRSLSGLSSDLDVTWLNDSFRPEEASIRVAHDLGHLGTVLDSLDRWFLGAFIAMTVIGLLGAWLAASRFTRPVVQLADATASVDLDHASPRFLATRRDEIGRLSRTMEAMVRRLRSSASRIRAAERKAALGDFARQANHDIKNGLTPISNVVSHLAEVAADPAELSRVFSERSKSLDSGIAYLRELSGSYARISSHSDLREMDVVPIIRETLAALSAADPRVHLTVPKSARADIDPLGLRRIVENLVTNALDSLPPGSGRVDVILEHDASLVRLRVKDNGPGIPLDIQDRLFEDFFTTRTEGSGLGLSIVRRLVLDLNGSVRVASEPGHGSEFIVEIPTSRH